MKIYAIFNDNTRFTAALVQGRDFDERGDDKWVENSSQINELFGKSDDDWIEISEEDFDKYMLGDSGGDNGTGYVRDPDTGRPVPKPPRPTEEVVAMTYSSYKSQIQQLKDAIVTATLADDTDLIADLKAEYNQLMSDYQSKLAEVTNNE